MFTGIVQGVAPITAWMQRDQFASFSVALPEAICGNLSLGASIAINGACLTVKAIEKQTVSFDAMMETLRVTNLAHLKIGDHVNIERAAKFGDEIGGHLLSGHIHCQAQITHIETPPDNFIISMVVDPRWQKYLFSKGYIGLNGASLTLGNVEQNRFKVYLIPETLRLTTFGQIKVDDWVNVEIDTQTQIIVETLENILEQRKQV
ncbi:MAG: hypothetical protein RIT27_2202 [Pseudomonadota bacterium]|jgi:riboflavin synthase